MYCVLCQKKIDETKGYFTIMIRGNRYDYHLSCRPANIPIQEKTMNEECVFCKRKILFDWVCDPDSSDRENPDYYHLGCWEAYQWENYRRYS